MINKGDYLICKKNFIGIDNKLYLKKGKKYKIHASLPNNILISPLYLWFNTHPLNYGYYIWDYFFTRAEYRENQINSILDD